MLAEITARLRKGEFRDQQSISRGIVSRVFQELGWDTLTTRDVWPEFHTREGRVDFALCHPPSKPAVFTKVEQLGKTDEAARRALGFAFNAGVPFVTLTDGRTWSFYLTTKQRNEDDRCVCKLDLFECLPTEAADILRRYLAHDHVVSGHALDMAREEYRTLSGRKNPALPPPLGLTKPSTLPTVRLSRQAGVIQQHHEALHHHFNSLTTLGNSLALLAQLADSRSGHISVTAQWLASTWSLAQTPRIEGLICYVAFKRASRRDKTVTYETYNERLPNEYRRLWQQWYLRYEGLHVQDSSRDALAMNVGQFCLNLPLYSHMKDIEHLEKAEPFVTEKILEDRFSKLEARLFSEEERLFLSAWESEVARSQSRQLPEEMAQGLESDFLTALFHNIAPDIESVPRTEVPSSVVLAQLWNDQLSRLGLKARVSMTDKGYIRAEQDVVVQPPATSVSGLSECSSPAEVIACLEDHPELCCLAICFRDNASHVFSRKYERTLKPGDVYMRFGFVRPDLRASRYDVALDGGKFAMLSPQEFTQWIEELSNSRLVVTHAENSSDLIPLITQRTGLPASHVWRIHWGIPVATAKESISMSRQVTMLHPVVMTVSKSAFWLVAIRDRPCWDVYPIPWEARSDLPKDISVPELDCVSGMDPALLFGILGLIISQGF